MSKRKKETEVEVTVIRTKGSVLTISTKIEKIPQERHDEKPKKKDK